MKKLLKKILKELKWANQAKWYEMSQNPSTKDTVNPTPPPPPPPDDD